MRLLIVTVEGPYPACAVHQDAEQSQHDSSNVIAAAVVCQHGSGPGLGDCASMARPPGIAIGVGDATDKGLGAVQVTGPRDAIIQRRLVSEVLRCLFCLSLRNC